MAESQLSNGPSQLYAGGRMVDQQDQMQSELDRVTRLQNFQATLVSRRTEAIAYRAASGLELRWIEDMATYMGAEEFQARMNVVQSAQSESQSAANNAKDQQPVRSTVHVHMTRAKTNAGSARMADMLFPGDDRNWGIQPTPVPMLSKAIEQHDNVGWKGPSGQLLNHPDTGQPLTVADIAKDALQTSTTACQSMEKEIDDVLTECGYNFEGRKVIQTSAILGVGILKGPVVVNRVRRKWVKSVGPDGSVIRKLEVVSENRPASVWIDPWNFFPDPACGEFVQNGEYVFERDYLSGRKLRELARVPGYLRDQIAEALKEGPKVSTTYGSYDALRRASELNWNADLYEKARFELWVYCGSVPAEDLIAAGATLPDGEILQSYSAIVCMVNDRIIYAMVNPQDTGDFPYDVFVWERVVNQWAGVGIPYLMRYSQRTLNAAWRAMLDNMAISYGPQIVLNQKLVRPYDGQWTITGRKLWLANEDTEDVQKAFWQFTFDSNQQELEAIINLAMKFADEETSLPQIAQGEKGAAPDTVGGMSLLMNSANTVLRRLVRQFDDTVTRPHITRYYDWMMQYSPKEDIKGDFSVDARGSTALVVRDEQKQGFNELMAAATHPVFSVFIDPKKLFEKALQARHISPVDVMKSDADIKALQSQPPQKPLPLQIKEAEAQSRVQVAQVESQSEVTNLQLRAQEDERKHEREMEMLRVKERLAILTLANDQKISLQDIKARLTEVAINANTQKELKAAELAVSKPMAGEPAPINQ